MLKNGNESTSHPLGYVEPLEYKGESPRRSRSDDGGSSNATLWVVGGLAVVLLLFLSGGSEFFKKASDGAGKVLSAAGEIAEDVASLADKALEMIGYTVTWPKLVRDAVLYPDKDIAELHDKQFASLKHGVESGVLAGNALYVGFLPALRLSPVSSGPIRAVEFQYAVDWRSPAIFPHSPGSPPGLREATDASGAFSPFKVLGVIAYHRSLPMAAINGHVYRWSDESATIFASIRAGFTISHGFNVFPDGSSRHATEGYVEAEFITAPLIAVEGGDVPLGPTGLQVTNLQVQETWRFPTAPGSPDVPPIRPWGQDRWIAALGFRDVGHCYVDYYSSMMSDWVVKVLVDPSGAFMRDDGTQPHAMRWRGTSWVFGDGIALDGRQRVGTRYVFTGDADLRGPNPGATYYGWPWGPAYRFLLGAVADPDWSQDNLTQQRGFVSAGKKRPRARVFVSKGPDWYEQTLKLIGTDTQRAALAELAKKGGKGAPSAPVYATQKYFDSEAETIYVQEKDVNIF